MIRRNTIQRDLVLGAVASLGNHATADEIYEFVKQSYPNIGRGTVYRNLGILSEAHDIKKISVPGGPDHFDHNVHEHYHVKCKGCERVFDVDMDVIEDLQDRIRDTHGMKYLRYDIVFTGICPECQKAEK